MVPWLRKTHYVIESRTQTIGCQLKALLLFKGQKLGLEETGKAKTFFD